jgi:hypothetical protein
MGDEEKKKKKKEDAKKAMEADRAAYVAEVYKAAEDETALKEEACELKEKLIVATKKRKRMEERADDFKNYTEDEDLKLRHFFKAGSLPRVSGVVVEYGYKSYKNLKPKARNYGPYNKHSNGRK